MEGVSLSLSLEEGVYPGGLGLALELEGVGLALKVEGVDWGLEVEGVVLALEVEGVGLATEMEGVSLALEVEGAGMALSLASGAGDMTGVEVAGGRRAWRGAVVDGEVEGRQGSWGEDGLG
ncbi:hypothetical protein NDU88_006248 [Pleurodeles waltl]|uniref:Uncharacterized protein n=1 Tax=Pleurodeles waltl TaxID=8319 RepID=A0AAV7RMI7_PLEWA|nr:hypothetical protein NDU88_006248 [Pleurodeles waltl]